MRVDHEFVYENKQAYNKICEYKAEYTFVHVLGKKLLICLSEPKTSNQICSSKNCSSDIFFFDLETCVLKIS